MNIKIFLFLEVKLIIEYYGKGGFDPLDSKNGYVRNVESVDYYE